MYMYVGDGMLTPTLRFTEHCAAIHGAIVFVILTHHLMRLAANVQCVFVNIRKVRNLALCVQ